MAPTDRPGLDAEGLKLLAVAQALLKKTVYALPEPDFDPLDAAPERLVAYGLPPRPPPGTEAFDAWTRLFTPPPDGKLTFLPAGVPELTPDWLIDGYLLDRPGTPRATGRAESSRNWSGVYIATNGQGRFKQTFGAWTVPQVSPPTPGIDGDYRCSTWTGLDGHRRHSLSMPQLGTTQKVKVVSGTAQPHTEEAWWQWWLRGFRFPPFPFPGFQVAAGQTVQCSLTILSPGLVLFVIRNAATGAVGRIKSESPGIGDLVRWGVRGVAAEWITERPTDIFSAVVYPLPNYGTVTYRGCTAIVEQPTPAGPAPVARDLSGARKIRMVAERARPARSAVISVAHKISDTMATTDYKP
ncbi:G1 family glutamic endopeptidase [Vineibacter terrae]|uniref:G1 family glutamic endopeptidase n=1 Tax=Vineibacter terrae TaxID=2586908 RepID=UPI002E32D5DA|nr:G1 family glutamic endopeptidase [Vineibacter terrae]HEX2887199.1 G1 family glutamic endopeptidase [Vineibacter terrae]